MILCRFNSLTVVKKMMERIEAEVNKKSYFFAYGYAPYYKGNDIDEICMEVDKKMYQMKAAMKAKEGIEA